MPIGDYVKCIKILDSQTILVRKNQKEDIKAQFYGITIPQTPDKNKTEAKKKITELILKKGIILQIMLPKKSHENKAIIYLGNKVINEELLKVGLAKINITECQDPYLSKWKSIEDTAKINKQGIWSD